MASNKKSIYILLINIAAMIVIGIVIVFLSLYFLKSYTRHDEAISVPDLKGLTKEEAVSKLASLNLYLQVTDSVFNPDADRGVILDFVPMAGSKIKKERTIYATINSTQAAMKKIPRVFEVSMRQAEALLMSNGFTNVTVKYIPGAYNDLAKRVTTVSGRELNEGEKVPYDEALILEVSKNDGTFNPDSLDLDAVQVDSTQNTKLDDNFF